MFWPEERYTKGDLLAYYRGIAPWMMPYLEDRPVVMTRYPDGIEGKSFYQKDAPTFLPDWIRRAPIWSKDTEKDIHYIVVDDDLVLRLSRQSRHHPDPHLAEPGRALQQPDWCLLDLDPKGAPFEQVVELALAIHELCEEIGLPCLPKTTGSTGLHALIPLGTTAAPTSNRAMLGNLLAAGDPRPAPDDLDHRRARSRRAAARSTSTSCRTATASSWSRRCACAHCPERRSRCRSSGRK